MRASTTSSAKSEKRWYVRSFGTACAAVVVTLNVTFSSVLFAQLWLRVQGGWQSREETEFDDAGLFRIASRESLERDIDGKYVLGRTGS